MADYYADICYADSWLPAKTTDQLRLVQQLPYAVLVDCDGTAITITQPPAQQPSAMSGTEVFMNPPINRENLRDVLIALVVATGLAWVVGAFQGCAGNTPPPRPSVIAQLVPSRMP